MKPCLAEDANLDKLIFPLYVSPKLDGVRCLHKDNYPVMRSLRLIPNYYIRNMLTSSKLDGLDGELIVGNETDELVFNITTSAVSTAEGEPNFRYFIFDYWNDIDSKRPFCERYENLKQRYLTLKEEFPFIEIIEHKLIHNLQELEAFEEDCLNKGYEGIIIRSVNGFYKYGRSSIKEGLFLRLKRFKDSEAEIIGFEELHRNGNEAKLDLLGYTERSTKKENLIPGNTLGSLIVRDVKTGIVFNIGSGLNDETRKLFWANRDSLTGKIIKYKYFPIGRKKKPRFPIYIGLRSKLDMDIYVSK